MKWKAGAAFYVKQGTTYILKLVGDMRYTMGCALADFLDGLFTHADYDDIVVDLTETHSIDSTSLGLLAKIANFNRQRFAHQTTLLSTNPDVNQILETMGFYEIFTIRDTGENISALQQLAIEGRAEGGANPDCLRSAPHPERAQPPKSGAFKGVLDNLRPKLDRRRGWGGGPGGRAGAAPRSGASRAISRR
ncbi:MAG: STAS domain-containing protein [Candidatus Competibacteraceae bacterium]|nr:STAS domain-containing protein [Candidatus Competibacteraceae bacterium]